MLIHLSASVLSWKQRVSSEKCTDFLRLNVHSTSLTVVISSNGKRFKLQLKPQWEKQDGLTMVTGAIIDNAPWNWTEMIMQMEPQDEDIWASN